MLHKNRARFFARRRARIPRTTGTTFVNRNFRQRITTFRRLTNVISTHVLRGLRQHRIRLTNRRPHRIPQARIHRANRTLSTRHFIRIFRRIVLCANSQHFEHTSHHRRQTRLHLPTLTFRRRRRRFNSVLNSFFTIILDSSNRHRVSANNSTAKNSRITILSRCLVNFSFNIQRAFSRTFNMIPINNRTVTIGRTNVPRRGHTDTSQTGTFNTQRNTTRPIRRQLKFFIMDTKTTKCRRRIVNIINLVGVRINLSISTVKNTRQPSLNTSNQRRMVVTYNRMAVNSKGRLRQPNRIRRRRIKRRRRYRNFRKVKFIRIGEELFATRRVL